MPDVCVQCAALERQLSDIRNEIQEEIRRGRVRNRRSATESDQVRKSLAELLASLGQTQTLLKRHRQECQDGP